MTTFYDLIKDLANHVGDVRNSLATGGSTTTLVDTTLIEPNDYYNGGTLLIDQATPVAVRITDFASTTGTFTFSAITTAVVSDIGYTAVHSRFPLDVLKRSINMALADIGDVMAVDETLTLVADQERYSLPTGVTDDIRRIEIGTEGDDDWEVHYGWKVEGGELRFLAWNPSDGSKTCRIHYAKIHDELTDFSDVVSEQINQRKLIVVACKHALIWRKDKVGNDAPNTTELLNYYLELDSRLRITHDVPLLGRDPILARY